MPPLRTLHKFAAAATLLAASVAIAQAQRISTSDVSTLLRQAILAADGNAHGTLTGAEVQAITRHFQATSPISIDVQTQRRYAQAGCSRLRVTFSQEGVLLPAAPGPRRQSIEFGIDYCLDGQPPKDLS